MALGANRWRILRLTLTETVLLGAAGGVVRILLAFWGLDLLIKTTPIDLPRLDEVRFDGRVLGFACLISILSGILFGFLPAWRLTGATPQEIMGLGSRTMTEGARGLRLGLAAGVAAALALGQVLRSLLFGVSATDPLTISAVIALLATVAALACYIPALRATRVPPIEALRYQ